MIHFPYKLPEGDFWVSGETSIRTGGFDPHVDVSPGKSPEPKIAPAGGSCGV